MGDIIVKSSIAVISGFFQVISKLLIMKQGQIGLEGSGSWSLILIHGPRRSRGKPTGSQGVKWEG